MARGTTPAPPGAICGYFFVKVVSFSHPPGAGAAHFATSNQSHSTFFLQIVLLGKCNLFLFMEEIKTSIKKHNQTNPPFWSAKSFYWTHTCRAYESLPFQCETVGIRCHSGSFLTDFKKKELVINSTVCFLACYAITAK